MSDLTGRGQRGPDGLFVDSDFDTGRPDPIEYEAGSAAVPQAADPAPLCPQCGQSTDIDPDTQLRHCGWCWWTAPAGDRS
ncbi:hypothetical protein [Tsukamurella sp. 1534]|uniref:hypothetical protein n=1 Tax=Tsukamurella sp. 1534 TaxID=1151061 RepID=UPI000319D5DA|nr:hypothetical protein [Tsukamurella sp. 1534]